MRPYSIRNGNLTINGTAGNDNIRLTEKDKNNFELDYNGKKHTIPREGITGIRMNGRGGDDTLEIGRRPTPAEMQANAAKGLPAVPAGNFPSVTIIGGRGNDTIRNFAAANATLLGGRGQNTMVNYQNGSTIRGHRGGVDVVENGGDRTRIDYSRGQLKRLTQVADRGTIDAGHTHGQLKLLGDNNTVTGDKTKVDDQGTGNRVRAPARRWRLADPAPALVP